MYGTCVKQNDLNLFHNIVIRLGEKYNINVTKAEIAFHVMEAELKRSNDKQKLIMTVKSINVPTFIRGAFLK